MQFQSLTEVGERFVLGLSLAGDIDIETLRDEPVALSPNCC